MKNIRTIVITFLFILSYYQLDSQVLCEEGTATVACIDIPAGYTEEKTATNLTHARICGEPDCGWYWYNPNEPAHEGMCTICLETQQ